MLQKNNQLYTGICEVRLKSVSGKRFSLLPNFVKVYSTPSKIDFSTANKLRAGGVEYTYKIKLFYPGLKPTDFSMFNTLTHDRFVAKIILSNKQSYVVGSVDVPLELTTSFKNEKGTQLLLTTKSFEELTVELTDTTKLDGFPYILTKQF